MFLTQAIGWIMAVLIVAGCLLLLWGMVSFSIIEPGGSAAGSSACGNPIRLKLPPDGIYGSHRR